MSYVVGAATDIGLVKDTNQDSLVIRSGKCNAKEVVLAVLCDGMGGLNKGELASAETVRRFSKWSEERLPKVVEQEDMFQQIKEDWNSMITDINQQLYMYGQDNHTNLGTTITGIVIVDNEYLIINVGDSRTYILDEDIYQLTEDQSLIAREVKLGRLTEEQAKTDPRKNVLLQCVGATEDIEVEFYDGKLAHGQGVLLCSDGFRHVVSDDEIYSYLKPDDMNSETIITQTLRQLIALNIARKESDNITAAFIKVV